MKNRYFFRIVLCCTLAATLAACQTGGGPVAAPTAAPATATAAQSTAPTSAATNIPAPTTAPTLAPTSAPAPTAAPTPQPNGDSENHELLFAVPAGPDGVTYRDTPNLESQRVGPSAFTVAPDGTFWIADAIGARVLHYSATGQRLGMTDLSDARRALIDIEAAADQVFVLDAGSTPAQIVRLAADGKLRGQYQLPAGFGANDGLTGLALTDAGELLVEKGFGTTVIKLLDSAGAVKPEPLPGYINRGIVYTARAADFNTPGDHTIGTIRAGDRTITVDTIYDLGGLTFTGFGPDGSFYVEAQELGPGVPFQVDQTVRHYTADGTLLGMARFPLAQQYTYVDQPMAVGPDGTVYAMLTRPEGVEIHRMRFARELKPILPPPGTVPEDGALASYADPAGQWNIQYPAGRLQVEDLGQGTIIFISTDRKTVVAVDSFDAGGNAYGNTGEDLRNRARDTLARIYGKPVNETGILGSSAGDWETGITFTTDKGSTGEAVYQQPGRATGNFRVYGVLYGYRADTPANRDLVEQIRRSFQITPASDTGGQSSDLDRARETLSTYFAALEDGRHAEAAQRFGGSFEALGSYTADVPPDDGAKMLEIACTAGFVCLKIRSVVQARAVSPTEFRFTVEFSNRDGTLFAKALPGQVPVSQFPFTVKKVGDAFLVQDLPLYVS